MGFGTNYLNSSEISKNSYWSQLGIGEVIEARDFGGDHGTSFELFQIACNFITPNSSESDEFISEFHRLGLGDSAITVVVLSLVPIW